MFQLALNFFMTCVLVLDLLLIRSTACDSEVKVLDQCGFWYAAISAVVGGVAFASLFQW